MIIRLICCNVIVAWFLTVLSRQALTLVNWQRRSVNMALSWASWSSMGTAICRLKTQIREILLLKFPARYMLYIRAVATSTIPSSTCVHVHVHVHVCTYCHVTRLHVHMVRVHICRYNYARVVVMIYPRLPYMCILTVADNLSGLPCVVCARLV